jgi:Ketopantoate reductase PanE/ApbA C terminal
VNRPIAFYPASVLFDCPNHSELLEKTGCRAVIIGVIDEMIALGKALGCTFPSDYPDQILQQMTQPTDKPSFMYTDYVQKRPMEVETYLGSPIRLAAEAKIEVPRIETLYAMIYYKNFINLREPALAPAPVAAPQSPAAQNLPPRSSSVAGPGPRPIMNGSMPNGAARRAPSMGGPQPPPMRRPGPPNGYGGRMPMGPSNSFPPNGPPNGNRRPSVDNGDLQEFSHLMLYDTAPDGGFQDGSNGIYGDGNMGSSSSDLALRERELALRQRELEMRERQMNMRRRGPMPPPSQAGAYDDDEDDDFFDPMENRRPNPAVLDENFDMMSVTSRRTRKASSNMGSFSGPPSRGGRNMFSRNRNRTSARLMQDVPGLHDSIMNNALMGYSSNRYGAVDRQAMGQESRQNSLTQAKLNELGGGGPYGAYPPMQPMQRRASQSPGNPLSPHPNGSGMKRPSPPNGANGMNGYGPPGVPNGIPNGVQNGRPSPPNGMMRQPVPRHPPGLGNAVAPYQVEQQAGVSKNPLKLSSQVRSLTGSASASAGSGDSANLDSDPSSNSSQSSFALGSRPRLGVRG